MKHMIPSFNKAKLAVPVVALLACCSLSGCWVAAAGAGAETAYVATQEDRSTSEVLRDQGITASVKAKLLADQTVPGMDINVDTHKGVVSMRGVLKRQAEVDQAIKLARSVNGVKDVEPYLYVK